MQWIAKNLANKFRYWKKKLKNSNVKTSERKKYIYIYIYQKLYWHCLETIEIKQNIYDYQIEKYKRKIG